MARILIVTDAWFPQVNGVVTVIDALSKNLERQGHTVSIMHPGLFHSIPFFFYPEVPLTYASTEHIQAFFDKHKPDYIHIATEWMLGLNVRRWCISHNIPFSTSYHTNFPLYVKHYLPFAKSLLSVVAYGYMRWFHSAAYITLVSTKTLQSELARKRFPHIAVWPFGIDTDLFVRAEVPLDPRLTKPVFMFLGRLAKEKSIEEFLKLELPGSKLVIGDGPEREHLESTYGKGALFVGYQKGPDLVRWLSQATVCVFPSRTETFGLSMVEALSCGIPVAAHKVLGPQDIITHGVDGYLSEDLGEAAMQCLKLSPEACREKALNYSWENSTKIFLKHIATEPGYGSKRK